jgi:hypothetical protein
MKTQLDDLEDLAAVVLVPTDAFRQALLRADPSLSADLEDVFQLPDSQTVVLVPSPEDDEELEEFLLPHKTALAEKELSHWIENPSLRPKVEPGQFDEWFEVRFHSVVVALGEE